MKISNKDIPIVPLNKRYLFDNFELEKKVKLPADLSFIQLHQQVSEKVFMKYKDLDTQANPEIIDKIKDDVVELLNSLNVEV